MTLAGQVESCFESMPDPPLLPTLPPEAQDEAQDDDPYGYAWAEPTDPDLQPNRVHPPTHRPKERA